MSSEYEWGRDQARFNGGGWRNDFTQAESSGYHYQRSLDEHQKFMREEDERRNQADEARRRAAQASATCYGNGDAGFGYGGASSGPVGGGVADGSGDATGLVVIGMAVLGGVVIVWLWKLILALLLIAVIFFVSLYAYDLCRHRRGFRPVGVVLDGIADDAERGFLAGLERLAVGCRGVQQRSTCTAARLAHRACIADSVPTRIRSRLGRAVLRRARRALLIASRWGMQGLARLAQVMAWGLQRVHAAW